MELKNVIENTWLKLPSIDDSIKISAQKILDLLNDGEIVICEKVNNEWVINDWIRKAIVLYFRSTEPFMMNGDYYDKIPLKFQGWNEDNFKSAKIRVVPGAIVRYGSFLSYDCIIMPSFINVGVYVGNKTMIDINATLGSCCYVGSNCHIGANSVIGGVLEPFHDRPTIIEDDVFIGASCSITSGIIVSSGVVIAPGTHISQSTRIYDSVHKTIFYGTIPSNAVVVSGTMPREGDLASITCAVIVKYADAQTRLKVGINNLLR